MKSLKQLSILAVLPALILGTAGCETMSEHKVASGAAIGATTGAVAGGIIGHQSGNKTQGALIGAAAGGLIGAGAGYWLEQRSKKFETIEDRYTQVETVPASSAPATVPPDTSYGTSQPIPPVREHIVLRLSDVMLFERGSSQISPAGLAKLNQIVALLQENPDETIVVKGYASSEGQDAANFTLSENRAKSVANYIKSKLNNPNRVTALGMGTSNPIASNDTEAGRAQNRRVEIEVFPPAGQR